MLIEVWDLKFKSGQRTFGAGTLVVGLERGMGNCGNIAECRKTMFFQVAGSLLASCEMARGVEFIWP